MVVHVLYTITNHKEKLSNIWCIGVHEDLNFFTVFLDFNGIFVIHNTVLYGFCYWHSERILVALVLILTYAVFNFDSSATTCKTVQHCCMESCRF
jgi:hypothetical protein